MSTFDVQSVFYPLFMTDLRGKGVKQEVKKNDEINVDEGRMNA
jgi:hypothetical protein